LDSCFFSENDFTPNKSIYQGYICYILGPLYTISGVRVGGALTNLFDKRYRIIHYGILTERIYMLFIVPVIILNLLGLVMAVAGHPLFGFALVVVAFLYIAKSFLD